VKRVARSQRIDRMACGQRRRQSFRREICFHLGDLDLYPETLGSGHTNA
jgi:hypothetical protein